jgi:pSer/pThr/pTyr-binding forkhead associated (FHA) protein
VGEAEIVHAAILRAICACGKKALLTRPERARRLRSVMAWFRNRNTGSRKPDDDAPTLHGDERVSVVVLEGEDTGADLVLAAAEVEIGRGAATLADGGRLTLRDRSVSNVQARLVLGQDGWSIEHNALATNPTLVNGDPVRRKRIAPGDRIRMGRVMLELRSRAAPRIGRGAPAAHEEHTELIRVDSIATTQLRAAPGQWGHLLIVQGPGRLTGTRFPLLTDSITIGRAQDCDLVLLDPGVSRRHAELLRDGEQVVLVHRSETNPTLHNGSPAGARTPLAHGDEIGLADAVLLRLELARPSAAAIAPAVGALRQVMEARVDLERRIEREFVRNGTFLDVDIADSYGLKASEPRAERVFVSFERFRSYLGERIREHRGRVLNSNGDEIMAFFDRAADAVSCARAMQTGLRNWNARENLLEREFRVRIGVHTGRSAVDLASGVAYSPVLDVAGHLQKNAPIGGVLVSQTTFAELGGEIDGLEPGATLARENMPTWVLAPERLAPA